MSSVTSFLKQYGNVISIDSPTRGRTITDLALVSEPGQVTDVAMEEDLGISIGSP